MLRTNVGRRKIVALVQDQYYCHRFIAINKKFTNVEIVRSLPELDDPDEDST